MATTTTATTITQEEELIAKPPGNTPWPQLTTKKTTVSLTATAMLMQSCGG